MSRKPILKKLFFLISLALLFFLDFSQPVQAVSEEECHAKEEAQEWGEAIKCWDDYFGAKKNTLRNEIQSKSVEIDLTTKRIVATRQSISQLEEEITNLDVKITDLDVSLDQLSEVLIKRISETYKKGKLDPLALLFSSKDFSQFVSRYKYLRVMQSHDRRLILEMETARTNYQDQKELKEEKQTKLESLKKNLEWEKHELDQAVAAKKILLSETEVSYQQALARIRAQQAKLSGVSLFGKPAEFKEWALDNHYFNQTDVRWAMMLIGGGVYANSYMWEYGCAVTSMAMVLHKWGVDIDPGRLSQSPIYRGDLIAWQDVSGPGGFGGTVKVVGHSYGGTVDWEEIDQTLSNGNWVIVYVTGIGHYVVLLNKEGDDYKIHDPYFGPNQSFYSRYSKGAVDEMIIYTR